ncbi:ribosome biogenesis protein BRX1 [Pancytospora philotis]|nr:ribosome biogenesis protein BRX1 [Pancytospora philotis]
MVSMMLSTKGASPSVKSCLRDLTHIIPAVKENTFDIKKNPSVLGSYMDWNECSGIVFFECTKRTERLWLATADKSVRMSIRALESIYDLSTAVNYHRGSGHVLLFTEDFETDPNLKLAKEMFERMWAPAQDAPVERVLAFYSVDGLIFVRHYLRDGTAEIGPRLTLELDKVLDGCFKGAPLFTLKKEE